MVADIRQLAAYRAVVIEGCDGSDGDMLLFQWGTYDWGDGLHFELGITRQFYERFAPDDPDGHAISQLNLTYRFEPTLELEASGKGAHWWHEVAEVGGFHGLVQGMPVFAALTNQTGSAVRLADS